MISCASFKTEKNIKYSYLRTYLVMTVDKKEKRRQWLTNGLEKNQKIAFVIPPARNTIPYHVHYFNELSALLTIFLSGYLGWLFFEKAKK